MFYHGIAGDTGYGSRVARREKVNTSVGGRPEKNIGRLGRLWPAFTGFYRLWLADQRLVVSGKIGGYRHVRLGLGVTLVVRLVSEIDDKRKIIIAYTQTNNP